MSDFFQSDQPSESNRSQHIEIDLMGDFYQELKAEFVLNRWTDKEGLYYLLAAGLATLQNVRQPREPSPGESNIINHLQSERARMHGRYAAMKHQVYELSQEVAHLEAKLKATQAQLNMLRKQK
ncbi:MAG TPA: hypothetical protein PKM21_16165 [Anaerolineales bacterium]|nr:hypothetical protein [Anaerolineales bacterium]